MFRLPVSGIILLALGAAILLNAMGIKLPSPSVQVILAIILIYLGLQIIFKRKID